MSSFDWLRMNNKYDFRLASRFAQREFLKFFIKITKLEPMNLPRFLEIDGFTTPYRVNRDCYGGSILLNIRQDIPSKFLTNLKISKNLEMVIVELNFQRKKWLVCCSHNPQKSNITKHPDVIGNNLDFYSPRYENYLLLRDLNSEPSENTMIVFSKYTN